MRRIYVVIPGPVLTGRLVQELLSNGLTAEQDMRLFSRQPKHLADVPVSVTSLRAASGKTLLRALMGGVIAFLALLLVLIASGGADAQSLLLVVATMTGAAAGAATALLQPFPPELRPLREELRHDDVVLVVEVPDARQGSLEQEIKARHPEIRVMGTDPGGSPPFP